MAAVLEIDAPVHCDGRARIVVFDRNGRKRREHVELRDRLRRLLDARELVGDRAPHVLEQLRFHRDRLVVRAENAVLELLQLLRDVALAVCKRLLADVMLRRFVLEGVRDLKVIAENAVEADAQLRDAGRRALPRLQLGNQLLAVRHVALYSVERIVVSLPDNAALTDRVRRLLDDRLVDQCADVLERVDLLLDRLELRRLALGGERFELRQARQRRPQSAQVLAVHRAVDNARHDALEVENAGEAFSDRVEQRAVVEKLRDGVLPQRDFRRA